MGNDLQSRWQLVAELNLPDYFGENLNALADCVNDLMSQDKQPLVLRIRNADELLIDASVESLHGFLSVFGFVGESWAAGINEGKEWDCPPRRFLVVLEYMKS